MRSDESPPFHPSAYDANLCLTPGPLFWLVNIFLLRPFIVFIASISARNDRFAILNLFYPDHQWAFLHVAAALPAFAVIVAYIRRIPKTGAPLRWIWQHGLWLILLSLTLNLVLLALPWLTGIAKMTPTLVAQLGGCIVAAYVLLRSRRLAAAFADFPPRPAAKT